MACNGDNAACALSRCATTDARCGVGHHQPGIVFPCCARLTWYTLAPHPKMPALQGPMHQYLGYGCMRPLIRDTIHLHSQTIPRASIRGFAARERVSERRFPVRLLCAVPVDARRRVRRAWPFRHTSIPRDERQAPSDRRPAPAHSATCYNSYEVGLPQPKHAPAPNCKKHCWAEAGLSLPSRAAGGTRHRVPV